MGVTLLMQTAVLQNCNKTVIVLICWLWDHEHCNIYIMLKDLIGLNLTSQQNINMSKQKMKWNNNERYIEMRQTGILQKPKDYQTNRGLNLISQFSHVLSIILPTYILFSYTLTQSDTLFRSRCSFFYPCPPLHLLSSPPHPQPGFIAPLSTRHWNR